MYVCMYVMYVMYVYVWGRGVGVRRSEHTRGEMGSARARPLGAWLSLRACILSLSLSVSRSHSGEDARALDVLLYQLEQLAVFKVALPRALQQPPIPSSDDGGKGARKQDKGEAGPGGYTNEWAQA
jgi:hypothetical protein